MNPSVEQHNTARQTPEVFGTRICFCHLETKLTSTAAFSPDGRMLAVGFREQDGAEREIGLWDIANRKWIQRVKAHSWGIDVLSFSTDGKRLASSSGDGTANIWSIPALELLTEPLKGPLMSMHGVGFSPDGKRLFTVGGPPSLVQLWETETFQQVAAIKGLSGFGPVVFPSDDSLLTVGWKTPESEARSAILWRANSFEDIRAELRARAPAN